MADPVNPNPSTFRIQKPASDNRQNVYQKEGFWLGRKIEYIRNYLKEYYSAYQTTSLNALNWANSFWNTSYKFDLDQEKQVTDRKFKGLINAASLFTINIADLRDYYKYHKERQGASSTTQTFKNILSAAA